MLVVLGAWLYPGTVGRARSWHVQPEIAVGALMAVVITVVLAALGAWLLGESSRQMDALRNPAPSVVNPILADAKSLAAGKAIYDERCAGCHGANGAGNTSNVSVPDIRARLPARRDEDLFKVIPHTNMPDKLGDDDHWNVINYLRSSVFASPEAAR